MFTNQRNLIRTFFIAWMIIISIFEVNSPLHFLILNTFLAYIPIELGFLLMSHHIKRSLLFWPIFIIWLLFYPNTPYILTDLFHLSLLNPYNPNGLIRLSISMWINYTFLFVSALGLALVGFDGLIKIAGIISNKIAYQSTSIKTILIVILTSLSSIGVFIGRFLRIHTVYLFISPRLFIRPLLMMWTPKMIAFVILFTFVQLFLYTIINLLTQSNNISD